MRLLTLYSPGTKGSVFKVTSLPANSWFRGLRFKMLRFRTAWLKHQFTDISNLGFNCPKSFIHISASVCSPVHLLKSLPSDRTQLQECSSLGAQLENVCYGGVRLLGERGRLSESEARPCPLPKPTRPTRATSWITWVPVWLGSFFRLCVRKINKYFIKGGRGDHFKK